MTKIFIDGKEGTTGLKIFERFADRRDVTVLQIPEAQRKDPAARREYINKSDITFLCLPDAAAREAAAMVESPHVTLIDASTAHRTNPAWSYGFPELSPAHRKGVEEGRRIAVPGCHASGFLSLVYPLRALCLLPADYPLCCYSLTGYSGGGKKMIAEYEAADRSPLLDAPRQYGISQQHKHLPEMQAVASLASPPIFAPIVADFPQGMEVSVPLYTKLLQGAPSAAAIHEALTEYYRGQPMIEVLPFAGGEAFASGLVSASQYAGSCKMRILVAGNDERVLLVSLFDNLGKGASGAAVQCMNISLGLDETTGLL